MGKLRNDRLWDLHQTRSKMKIKQDALTVAEIIIIVITPLCL